MGLFLVVIICACLHQVTWADYWSDRDALLEKERRLLLGGNLVLSEKEQKVNSILMQLKLQELDDAFDNLHEFAPSKHFFKTKKLIENSTVFEIIKNLPKGASLHSHDFSSASFEGTYRFTYFDNLYGCIFNGKLRLRFFGNPPRGCDWRLIKDLRKNASFESYLRSALSIMTDNPDQAYPDINSVWRKFSNAFGPIIGLLTYKPAYERYFWTVLEEFYNDNVKYIEFRTLLPTIYDQDGTTYGPEENVKLYVETLEKFKKKYPDFIGAKMIYSPSRTCNLSVLQEDIKVALHLQTLYPDFVAGFDLVGQEDPGNPLMMYAPELLKLSGKMKFFFHAAETDWNGERTDTNLVDAVLLNTSRIGHGYGITKHPEVLKNVIERGIAIEISPISNQVLRLVEDLRNHPAAHLFNINAPVVVSCDDPGMWGSKGLSYDWYMSFVGIASRQSDLRFLKQLALNSIEYSAMTEDEKSIALKQWYKDWEVFLDKIIKFFP